MSERHNSFSINNYEVEGAFRYYFVDAASRIELYNYMNSNFPGCSVGIVFHLQSILVDDFYRDEFEKIMKELDITPTHVE